MRPVLAALSFLGRSVVALLLMAFAGCSTSMEPLGAGNVSAAGTLTYRGEPVAGAQLIFWSDETAEPPFAQTDSQGRFACVSNDTSSGLLPGEYLVTVFRPMGGIPKKYADAATSPLSVTIGDAEENVLPLVLED